MNNREIVGRYDDSVIRILNGGAAGDIVQFIRRARGYAPLPIPAPCPEGTSEELLAVGPEQKSTLTYARAGKAFVSQHVGDLESAAVFDLVGTLGVPKKHLLKFYWGNKPYRVR